MSSRNPHSPPIRRHALAWAAGIALLATSLSGWADPPARVARLGYLNGAVSFSPAGEDAWDQAAINRPLAPGDRLWSDDGARAEVQMGGAMVRLDARTAVTLLNLDDDIAQVELTQGALNVHVRRLDPDQVVEIDTPQLSFTLREAGDFRIEVDPEGQATTITMRQGRGEVSGDAGSQSVESRQVLRFGAGGALEAPAGSPPAIDEFDRWAGDRDRAMERSASARYVSADVVGYQDLDDHGRWEEDRSYGHVWYPSRVAVGWAPYRDGHWAWIDPWGWTWVDEAPWGFAVSHYGRWASVRGRWGWVPGPMRERAYYAPALVVFVGGPNVKLTISSGPSVGIGWFPLGPREVYRPTYAVSRKYFEGVNRGNTVVNTTVINNVYTNVNVTKIVYVNRKVPGAVVAVPAAAFSQSQPVAKLRVRLSEQQIDASAVTHTAALAPTEKSVHGGAAAAAGKPPAKVFERPVVARTAPPAQKLAFAAQQPHLAAHPGKPLDEETRQGIAKDRPAPAQQVKVLAPRPGRAEAGGERADAPAARASAANEARGATDEHSASSPAPRRTAPLARRDHQGAAADEASPRASAPAGRRTPEPPAAAPATGPGASASAVERRAAKRAEQAESRRAAAPTPQERRASEAKEGRRVPAQGDERKPPAADAVSAEDRQAAVRPTAEERRATRLAVRKERAASEPPPKDQP